MNIQTVHKQIMTSQIDKFYIFYGEECAVRDVYIDKIVEKCKSKIVCHSYPEVYLKLTHKSLLSNGGCIVVYNDKNMTKEPKQVQSIIKAVKNSKYAVILVYDTLDKRSKMYKQFEDYLVEFNPINTSVLVKHIKNLIPSISESAATRLSEVCENNYNRILLECDKVCTYMKIKSGITADDAVRELLSSGVIYQPIGDITFDFVNAIVSRNKFDSFDYSQKAKEVGENPILTLSVLYSNIKNILLVEEVGVYSRDIAQQTTLTPYQIMQAKKFCGQYSTANLLYILETIRDVEKGIKTGTIDMDIAVDYLLVHIL